MGSVVGVCFIFLPSVSDELDRSVCICHLSRSGEWGLLVVYSACGL